MGIRVHKEIGYGMKDLKTKPERPDYEHTLHYPADPRWDFEKYQERWDSEVGDEDFIAWLETPENAARVQELAWYEGWGYGRDRAPNLNGEMEIQLLLMNLKDEEIKKRRNFRSDPYGCFSYDAEFGDASVALFRCPEHPDWHRYDDIIDYYEESGTQRATILEKSTGIFPYDGFVKRFREPTPEVAELLLQDEGKGSAQAMLRAFAPRSQKDRSVVDIDGLDGGAFNQLVGRWGNTPAFLKDEVVQAHLVNDWRPRVPVSILALMEFMECFPNPTAPDSMLNSLRPMVYVYWG